MPVPLLDLRAQHSLIKDEVVSAMMRVVEDQLFILGPPVQQLEEELARLSHTTHAIGCASGTDALLLALRALNIGRGDEVVTTPFTFFATAGTVHNVGAKPVFCDIDPATFNMLPAAAAAACTSRTRATIPVDLFGQMAPLEYIASMTPGVPMIEDAAQTIGASRMIDGERRMAGEIATIGTFSFFPSKNLGGYGDGGMMVTQDDALARRLKRLRVHGGMQMYHHDEVGYNSRLDSLQAAVLHAKLRHLSHWSAARRANAAYYTSAFSDVAELRTPVIDPVLKGGFVFMADLVRAMSTRVTLDFIAVSSYQQSTRSSGEVRLLKDVDARLEGRHVIIVEDIVDTGLTLTYLQDILRARAPKSLRTACLLSKPSRRLVDVKVEYIGFTIEDKFVIGYGLDFAEKYRNLPHIAVMDEA